jgi:hypothetical protein
MVAAHIAARKRPECVNSTNLLIRPCSHKVSSVTPAQQVARRKLPATTAARSVFSINVLSNVAVKDTARRFRW